MAELSTSTLRANRLGMKKQGNEREDLKFQRRVLGGFCIFVASQFDEIVPNNVPTGYSSLSHFVASVDEE